MEYIVDKIKDPNKEHYTLWITAISDRSSGTPVRIAEAIKISSPVDNTVNFWKLYPTSFLFKLFHRLEDGSELVSDIYIYSTYEDIERILDRFKSFLDELYFLQGNV
jgi:hypothetical protein